MDLVELIQQLDTTTGLERYTTSLKNDGNAVSWKTTTTMDCTFETDEEEVTIEDLIQLCLVHRELGVIVYFNYTSRREYLKRDLEDLISISLN